MIHKARYRSGSDTEFQTLSSHLFETGMLSEMFGRDIGLSKLALLMGFLHDLGKNCYSWQNYLEKNKSSERHSDKEDHATAGGQYLYRRLIDIDIREGRIVAEILAACIMYHHGQGLPDVVKSDGTPVLQKRLAKTEQETHCEESFANLDNDLKQTISDILNDDVFIPSAFERLISLSKIRKVKANRYFNLGFTARFLSSCLIDADRRSSADYDQNIPFDLKNALVKTDWKNLLNRLENYLLRFPQEGHINQIRRDISQNCASYAGREDGIYTLTAATGSGKTLAALRYALVHAAKYQKDRIFIIAPYTSILDQNADVIRSILDPDGENGSLILEHHSNLDVSEKSEYYTDASQTWNVPIVITTMVQFLEALFGYGTRKIRRMHQFANSVIIFDEVQTLPVSCTYLFTWALDYLCTNCKTSALLCTATQPGLDKIKSKDEEKPYKYALNLKPENEIVSDITKHFIALKRVELVDKTKQNGWSLTEVADFIDELPQNSILTVVNTKKQAQVLYKQLKEAHPDWHVIHLSDNMCPAHRKKYIGDRKNEGIIKQYIRDKSIKCVCVSTRLIEAGVDLDFDAAIRFFSGFDSVVQTAGRCNRNGNLRDEDGNPVAGKTYIINITKDEERVSSLKDLQLGQEIMSRILREYHVDEAQFDHTLLHPELISRYFSYYYGQLPESTLKYKIDSDTALNLLSENTDSVELYKAVASTKYGDKAIGLTEFCQSFETAWRNFEVISNDTVGVIVPYEYGKDIIGKLFASPDIAEVKALLMEAQQYSVNAYFNQLEKLQDKGVISAVPSSYGLKIFTLNEGYYDADIGVREESVLSGLFA
ncbi:MAG: CRISPR-associated helicase Cas3' [Spirochaetaceae bacterium]|jgi:CRISPR-associated endonuclease/helicase Cas3|nr:CRISPR-associated helicase Cas3' [Spirochaetaceae bacterium]